MIEAHQQGRGLDVRLDVLVQEHGGGVLGVMP